MDEDTAKLRGTRLHLLLEHLAEAPRDRWDQLCVRLLPDMHTEDRQDLLNEAVRVLTSETLASVFSENALAEAPVSATVNGHRIHGVIDRLIVTDTDIQVIDFKTNATVPDRAEACPEGLLRQMGAYADALSQIYPDRPVRTAILWTRSAKLMWLPHDLVTDALARARIS